MTQKKQVLNEHFIEAATGQGKSYLSIVYCIQQACFYNKRCIIATSNLTMLDQTFDLAVGIHQTDSCLTKKRAYRDYNITIKKHSSAHYIEDEDLLKYYEKGSFLIITLHPYLREMDDFSTLSNFYKLLQIHILNTIIFIDESQYILDEVSKRYNIESLFGTYDGQSTPISNVSVFNVLKSKVKNHCFSNKELTFGSVLNQWLRQEQSGFTKMKTS